MIYHPDIIADVARGRVAELVGAGGQHRPAKKVLRPRISLWSLRRLVDGTEGVAHPVAKLDTPAEGGTARPARRAGEIVASAR